MKRKAHVEVKLSSPCLEVLFASLAATFFFWTSFLFGGPHTFGRTLRVRSFSRQLLLQACCLSQVADWVADCFAWWFWQPSMNRLRLTLTCRGGWRPRLSSDLCSRGWVTVLRVVAQAMRRVPQGVRVVLTFWRTPGLKEWNSIKFVFRSSYLEKRRNIFLKLF